MRLIAYRLAEHPAPLRPASARRAWMDDTTKRFIYRCLPMTVANQHGWEVLCPCSFDALWTGGRSESAIQIVRVGSAPGALPMSHFGEGVLTFRPGYLFRTESPFALYVTGPPNLRKDGIAPLSGIVETDWLPFPMTMNWVFTRVGIPVRFEEGEPFCHVFPIDRRLVEQTEPELRELDSDPVLKTQHEQWDASRKAFNDAKKIAGSQAAEQGWQRFYSRGTLHTGEAAQAEHRTRLVVRPFVQCEPAGGAETRGRVAEEEMSSTDATD